MHCFLKFELEICNRRSKFDENLNHDFIKKLLA